MAIGPAEGGIIPAIFRGRVCEQSGLEFGVYRRIILPLGTSALGAISIVSCVYTSGLFFWPLVIANSKTCSRWDWA